ncbi:MAG: GMC family oxidoreductase N-terminal domain-containing protein, partial [Deltaproteobacteria bacterium]|nr:GMC family oxidoreductase N-terminal domain-containing protein [Deltaproteobacteria bacterium]
MITDTQFDYVLVGGGTAGCVLANRLSADPSVNVLVLEEGGDDRAFEVRVPAAFSKLFQTARDWAYDTVEQPALGGRRLFWPRGKMLGGCSSMNAQLWVRGHRADYDAWEEAGGRPWGWDAALEAYHRAERRDGDGRGLYGRSGPMWISDLRDPNVTTPAFLAACEQAGIRRIEDLNQPDNEGCAPFVVTQRGGRRFSVANGYIEPIRGRPNLRVELGARTRRVLFEGRRAVGVELVDRGGRVLRVHARREVVLCGGAIGTPQLLMVSGVGPAEHLREHGIAVVADAPEVGSGLQDHLAIAVIHACPEPVTLTRAESPMSLLRYLIAGRGMLTSSVAEAAAFVRSRPDLAAPDIELVWAPVPFVDHGRAKPTGHGVTLGVVLLQPKSRGTIRLSGADPLRPPRIDPGYLSDPQGTDLAAMVAGVRRAREILGQRALARYVGAPMEPHAAPTRDDAVAAFVRAKCETLYHPVGTCRMGTDPRSVVDPSLRVRGVT